MPRCSAAGLDFRIIPAGFNAPLEFLTGFTLLWFSCLNLFKREGVPSISDPLEKIQESWSQ